MGDEKLVAAPDSGRQAPADSEAPVVWHTRHAAASRHGAISRQLFTYSNYKQWVERMRVAWEDEDSGTAPRDPPRGR